MKRIFIIGLFVCVFLESYSQDKNIKEFAIKAELILSQPVDEKNISAYDDLIHKMEYARYTYYGGRNKKKNDLILDEIDKRVSDSIFIHNKREEETRLKNEKVQQVADSIIQDSIQKARIVQDIERTQWDSIRRIKQQEFFSIESIVKSIGKNTYSKENIENSLYIYPIGYQGTSIFYELDDMFITIKYVGLDDICIELGFRLFGEDASIYKKELMNAGFKYQKTFRETMIENHSEGYSNLSGAEIQRYRKFTGKEYVICDIYYDRFTFFKFYRARYKK